MKVFYLNDETITVKVRTIDKDGESKYTTLAPQESKVFEVYVPEESALFVKRWDSNIILLTCIPLVAIQGTDT